MQYQGVLHMHSTHSYDGSVPLAELKTLLKDKGISFACMTEHTDDLNIEKADAAVEECRRLSDESFLFIPGFEVPYKHTHVLMFGATEFICQKADVSQLRLWCDDARLVILAHPQRNKFLVDDALFSVLDGVEIWNQQYDGKRVPRTRSFQLLRDLRNQRPELLATGGLDLHRTEHLGLPTVAVTCDALTEDAVFDALISGSYTFGGRLSVPARGIWEQESTFGYRCTSHLSTAGIFVGKRVSALLAFFGIKLPNGLRQLIRSKI